MISIDLFRLKVLGVQLYPLQSLILTKTWENGTSHAVYCLGRRSGKTLLAAISATYAGVIMADSYKKHLGRKKEFTIYLIANSKTQSKIALKNIKDLIAASTPVILSNGKCFDLRDLVIEDNKFNLALNNGVNFVALPTSSRTARGEATPLIVMDEIAHSLDTDGDSSASTIYQALKPGSAQFGELSRTIMLSSPWKDSGLFFDFFKAGVLYNPKTDTFVESDESKKSIKVFNFPTWEVNFSVPVSYLKQEEKRDPELFWVEYGAQFSKTLARFLHSDIVEGSVRDRHKENDPLCPTYAPNPKYKYQYVLGLDQAKGGVGRDDYVACLCHYEKRQDSPLPVLVVDFFKEFQAGERGIVSTLEILAFIREIDRVFGLDSIALDQYESSAIIDSLGGEYSVVPFTWSLRTHTIVFSKIKELFFNDQVELPYYPKAINQLKGLKRELKSSNQFKITGGQGTATDDYCFAFALAAYHAQLPGTVYL